MNEIASPAKFAAPQSVTTGPIAGSRKIYAAPKGRADIRVPFREIALSDPGEALVRVYDPSGPYTEEGVTIDLAEGLRPVREAWVTAITALLHDPPLLLLLGMIVVAVGLALVLTHNIWSGGTLPVVVTVIGWLTLGKGLMFWCLPAAVAADLYLERLHYGQLYYLYCGFSLAIGLYLTLAGFRGQQRAR